MDEFCQGGFKPHCTRGVPEKSIWWAAGMRVTVSRSPVHMPDAGQRALDFVRSLDSHLTVVYLEKATWVICSPWPDYALSCGPDRVHT